MSEFTIVRLVGGQLVWYPPGTEGGAPLDNEEARAAAQTAARASRAPLCFAVPGADVLLERVEFAAAERKHILKSLPYTLEDQLITDVQDLHFATVSIDKSTLGVAVCSTENMNQWQALLADLSDVSCAVPEPLLLPWQAGQWTVLIEGDQAVVRHGQYQGFATECSLLPSLLEATSAANELPPEHIVLYGSDQERETQLVPEQHRAAVQWRQGDFSAARLIASQDGEPLNLIQGAFAPSLPLGRWWLQWRAVAAVFLAAFAIQVLATYADYRALLRENTELRTGLEATTRTVIPRGALVDHEKQVRRQLDALKGSAQSSGFVSLVYEVGQIIAEAPGAQISSINYNDKGNQMRMNIMANDFGAVESIRTAIADAGMEAVMESSSVQGDQVRARIRVEGRS